MAFSDSIESTFLNSVYVVRRATAPDSLGNYGTTVTTGATNLLGDIQAARMGGVLYSQTARGADYRITHMGFFDVPSAVPVEGDDLIQAGTTYAVRNVRNWKDHLELELERLGI